MSFAGPFVDGEMARERERGREELTKRREEREREV